MCECSLEELVAGAWQVQDHLDRLADAADHPRGLHRGLASMSAVAEQRTKLQVCALCLPYLAMHQITDIALHYFVPGKALLCFWQGPGTTDMHDCGMQRLSCCQKACMGTPALQICRVTKQ